MSPVYITLEDNWTSLGNGQWEYLFWLICLHSWAHNLPTGNLYSLQCTKPSKIEKQLKSAEGSSLCCYTLFPKLISHNLWENCRHICNPQHSHLDFTTVQAMAGFMLMAMNKASHWWWDNLLSVSQTCRLWYTRDMNIINNMFVKHIRFLETFKY